MYVFSFLFIKSQSTKSRYDCILHIGSAILMLGFKKMINEANKTPEDWTKYSFSLLKPNFVLLSVALFAKILRLNNNLSVSL